MVLHIWHYCCYCRTVCESESWGRGEGGGVGLDKHFYKGKFCSLTRVKGKNGKTERQYTPLDPQPDQQKVVVVHRYYTNFKTDKSYKKRVTWLGEGGLTSSFALIEYLGSHPGLLPHGNSKDQKSEYLRTPNFVMEEAEQMLIHDKPKAVYERMKMKYDELTRPTGLQKLRDKKKNYTKKQNPDFHSNNIADNFQEIENLVMNNDAYIRSVIRTNGKTPCIILYSDEQIADLKTFCCSGLTVLGVDKTFNLCDMHVTVTSYKNLSVTKSTTKEPPIFLCDCGNAHVDYVTVGTRNRTTSNHREYSVSSTLRTC